MRQQEKEVLGDEPEEKLARIREKARERQRRYMARKKQMARLCQENLEGFNAAKQLTLATQSTREKKKKKISPNKPQE
jgi:hypothetical protein